MADATEAQQIQRYYAEKTSVIGNASTLDKADILMTANVTYMYGDTDIDSTDAQQIQRYYADKTSTFDLIK